MINLGYEKAIVKMYERYGFKKRGSRWHADTFEGIAEKLENLKDFTERLKYLEHLLRTSKFKEDEEKLDEIIDYVTLSTLHSLKGLESPRVFIIDLIDRVCHIA